MDPNKLNVSALIQSYSVTQMQRDRAISAYRNNIALPEVHVAALGDKQLVESVGQDGESMSFERRQQLMQGKPTWKDEPELDRRGLQTEEELPDETLGSAEICRRLGLRKVVPVSMTQELLDERKPPECVWSSGSDACTTAMELFNYMEIAVAKLVARGRKPGGINLSSAGADTIAWMLSMYFSPELPESSTAWMDLVREIDDKQFHHVQLWAEGNPRMYASVFLHRELMQRVQNRAQADTDTVELDTP